LMNSGGNGTNPARIDGYLALSCGWRDPVDLAGSDAETLTLDAEAATILRYRKPGVLTEYFLMENRWTGSASGRDASLPCSGLAIWHCDELGDHNDQRYAKNAQHNNYEVALVQADNLRDFENNRNPGDSGDSGDLWYTGNPAPTYTGSFNDGNGSDPTANDARWWDGTASGLDLSEPSAPGQTISFIGGRSSLSLTSATYTVTEGNSGTTYAQIQVRRAGSRRGAVTLNWSTADSTASVAGHDYLTASGTVTWVDGETGIKSFPVPVLGDTMSEADETVVINVTAAGASVPIPTAMLTIVNDDGTIPYAGSLELTTYALSVTEGSSGLTSSVPIPVRRRGGSSGEVSVAWSTAGTAATSGILTWANGDAADKYILVPVLADSDPEGDEAVTITLGAATGGPAVPTPNQAVLTILNDDYAVSFLSRTASLAEPANAIGNGTVAVQLIGQLHGTVSVDYRWLTTGTATPDLDYVTQSPGTLTWSPGSSVYQMISIPVYADNEADGGETVQIALRNPVGASLREPTTVTVTIRDYLPSGSAADSAHAGGTGSASMCGAGGLAGLICLGGLAGLGLLRRRRR
jgi:hypothetical protein